jgi:hypothetical protein
MRVLQTTQAASAAAMILSSVLLGGCVAESGARPTSPTGGPPAPAPTCPETAPTAAPTATGVPVTPNVGTLYNEAISTSAVVTPGAALPLVPLKPDAKGTFTVTTWAGCRGDGGPNKCGSYVAQQTVNVMWDVWVTSNNEVQNKCKTWKGDLVLQVNQLLGLPAPASPLPPDTTERQFVTFTGVPAASIFRPCTDTRVDTDHCDGTKLPDTQGTNAPADYYKWFTKQAMSSWQISEKVPPAGFPWTRLGYTYNWAPGATNHYGASEYVISGGSKAVTLTVASVQTVKDFCKP